MPLSDWVPTVQAVGTRLYARTVNSNGVQVGTFDPTTRPTGDQVMALILDSQVSVAAEITANVPASDGDVPANLQAFAAKVVALGAAKNIELAFFPEQIKADTSPYKELKEEYDEALKMLLNRITEQGGAGSEDVAASGSPSYGFPANAGGMVGYGTVW